MNVIELLLSKRAYPNDKDNDGVSPIICASRLGHVNVVEMVIVL